MTDIIKAAQNGDTVAMDKAVQENMGLVHMAARRFIGRGTDYDDLAQIASMGLIKAIRHFDTEKGLAFSTYAVPAIVGELKRYFIEGIRKIEKTVVHGRTDETSAPHIISVGFAGIRSEVLLHTLEDKGIYVSAGSACASNHPAISGVLRGIGVRSEYLDSTLRFSMSEFTTKEEIDYTLKTLYNCVPMLRRYTRY